MPARRLTRRSLLAAGAGALAGGLARPAGVLAALAGPPQPVRSERWVGELPAGGQTIELSRNADLVGVEWSGPAQGRVELRFRGHGGRWSRWVAATGCSAGHHHGPDRPGAPAVVIGEPVWSGGTAAVQLRATRALSGVRLHLIDVSDGLGASRRALAADALALAGSLPVAAPVLSAGAGQPAIIARRAWARGMAHPRVAPAYGAVRVAFVHHTENPNGYSPGEVPAILLAIFIFHRDVRGWNDIGYNFVIDLFGRVFEGRAGGVDEPVVGAHAGGYNLVSSGVAVLGSFVSAPISAAARQTLERLLAWKLSLHGAPSEGRVTVRVNPAGAIYSRFPANAPVALPRIAGHRDGDTTDCPGDALYGELRAIRPSVARLAPRPARATLVLSAQATQNGQGAPAQPIPPTPGQATPGASASVLAGSLALLDGTPLAGAPIAVQARSVARHGEIVRERTIAQAVTDARGSWSLPVTLSASRGAGMWLRALYAGSGPGAPGAGAGASISDPLHIPAAALSVPQAPPPTPAGAAPPAT
jgi:N-acetylmuramoyl-L-alanine amidase